MSPTATMTIILDLAGRGDRERLAAVLGTVTDGSLRALHRELVAAAASTRGGAREEREDRVAALAIAVAHFLAGPGKASHMEPTP